MIDLSGRMDKIRHHVIDEARRDATIPAALGVESVTVQIVDGHFRLVTPANSWAAHFNLVPLPNCGAVAVFCDLFVQPDRRRKGVARAIEQLVRRAAQQARITLLLATVRADSHHVVTFFTRQGWGEVATFRNPETGNVITLFRVAISIPDME